MAGGTHLVDRGRGGRALAGIAFLAALSLLLAGGPAHAAFPGQNGKIAFVTGGEIYTMNADGSGSTRLTSGSDPAWSPNGSQIAFQDSPSSIVPGSYSIYTMNADGSGRAVLMASGGGVTDTAPAWSAGASKIAFVSTRDQINGEIYFLVVQKARLYSPTRLTNNSATDAAPAWSPDGSKIAFASDRDAPTGEIYAMTANGRAPRRLTNNSATDAAPAWSPDGTMIAFVSDRDGNTEIYVMYANGSNSTRLTNNVSRDNSPAWSPDGSKIVFGSNRAGGSGDVYVMNADGSGQTRLTGTAAGYSDFDWQPIDTAAPAITSLGVKRGAIHFKLSEAATVMLSIQRKGGPKRKTKLEVQGRKGKNSVPFGRIGKRKLAPGGYQIVATATDAAGHSSKPRRGSFKIAGRK